MKVLANSVTSSKLFRTSPRRQVLASKLNSSIGLQIQDVSDIDESYNVVDVDDVPDEEIPTLEAEASEEDVKDTGADSLSENSGEESMMSVSFKNNDKSTSSSKEVSSEESNPNQEAKEGSASSDEEVKTSTSVTSSSGCPLPTVDVTEKLRLESSDIMGMLNSKDDTSGVIRVNAKNNEVWIHYNDSVNLNDVMVSVIEQLNRPGYTYLEFNRLARSENAVVFVVLREDTDRSKKPESSLSTSED